MFELSGVNYEEVLEQGDSILVRVIGGSSYRLSVIGGSSYRGFELSGLYCIYTWGFDTCIHACMHPYIHTFCPGTMTTHAESINSDLQRGLDRRLRHTQH